MRADLKKRRAQLREFHALGQTQGAFQRLTGMNRVTICKWAREFGLKFRKDNAGWSGVVAKSKARAEEMASLYRSGMTLENIGSRYGITRERVRQIMTKYLGIGAEDGGRHLKMVQRKARRKAQRDGHYLTHCGCTADQWQYLRDVGFAMLASGRGKYQTPLRAFQNQRNNAGHRGIEWDLTLWQWWQIWESSGHWENRGRGQGYVMCRIGDRGGYSVGNVFIATAAENSSEGQAQKGKASGLPIGVSKTKSGKYVAKRRVDGTTRKLGTHASPELAHAAYVAAGYSMRGASA